MLFVEMAGIPAGLDSLAALRADEQAILDVQLDEMMECFWDAGLVPVPYIDRVL
jgi:hypothetical protein